MPTTCYVLPVDDVDLLPKLPEHYQQLLLATRTMEQPTYKKLAHQFGIPMGTVKSRLYRGKAWLNILRLKAAPDTVQAGIQ